MPTEAQIATAFKKGVRSIVDATPFNALRDAIRDGNYGRAVELLRITPDAFEDLRVALVETYAEGGVSAITGMKFTPKPRWNGVTAMGEEYARIARDHMGDLASDMRAAVSWQIGDSLAFGRTAHRTALDLVGRVGASGRREGGIVGLNTQRAGWVSSLRQALESGAPVKRELLTAAEQKLIDRGELSQPQIDRIVQSYSNRQLLSRGKAIARTERQLALNQGQYSAYAQAAERLGVPYSAIRKKWKHDGVHIHERWEHVRLANEPAIPFDQAFIVGGQRCQYPHDPNLTADQVVNCLCSCEFSIPSSVIRGR